MSFIPLDLLLLPIISCFLVFFLYGTILLFFIRNVEEKPCINYFPKISIVFPTYNESYVIENKLKNLMDTNYPQEKIEIIVADDSTDNTSEIIQRLQKSYSNIILERTGERRGYSQSMIDGIKHATGEIIVISDAGSYYDKNTLPNLIRHFNNPKIGAVSGKAKVLNKRKINAFAEHIYRIIYDRYRIAESNIDSTFHLNGEACAIRKEVCQSISSCPANYDIAIGFATRKLGLKAIVDLKAYFYEKSPELGKERIHQKSTRAFGIIRILFNYRDMMLKKEYGLFGLIIYPFNFIIFVVMPLMIAFSIVLVIFYLFFRFAFPINLIILGSIIILLLVLYPITISFVQFEFALIIGLYKTLFYPNQKDEIRTITSTRIKIEEIKE
ncbi:MAG: glycosyltransferase [Candidatus Heimdallarchaeaceae archaeon]